jgi:hypothetical protein
MTPRYFRVNLLRRIITPHPSSANALDAIPGSISGTPMLAWATPTAVTKTQKNTAIVLRNILIFSSFPFYNLYLWFGIANQNQQFQFSVE